MSLRKQGRNAGWKDLVDLLQRVAATEDHPVYGEDSEEEEYQVQISSRGPGRSQSAFATGASSACPVCGATDYRADGCSKFAALRPKERLKEAIQTAAVLRLPRAWSCNKRLSAQAEVPGSRMRMHACFSLTWCRFQGSPQSK